MTVRSYVQRRRVRRTLGVLSCAVLALACDRETTEPETRTDALRAAPPAVESKATIGLTEQDGKRLSEVVTRALPAVVSVASTRVVGRGSDRDRLGDSLLRRFFGEPGHRGLPFPIPPGEPPVQRGLGSGVIVGSDVILTNAHVVDEASDIVVTMGDGRELSVELAGSDPKTDLAVLRIKGDTSGLTTLPFADSSTTELGQIVLAIGQPFGLSGTVTMGIISAKSRANLGIVDYEDFLQTDAAINPGNSGGALIDLEGRLIGVPTAILSPSGGNMGVGFAIPSNMAKPIMTSLLEHGRVIRGFLGATIQTLEPPLARALGLEETKGVLIGDVLPDGPAAKAGLKRGDVVLEIAGAPVATSAELRNRVASLGEKKGVELVVVRDGKRQRVSVDLAVMPEEPSARREAREDRAPSDSAAGLLLAPLNARTRGDLGVPSTLEQGVVVANVQRGSPAAEAGLMPGDVIVEINREAVTSPSDVVRAYEQTKGPLALLVWRNDSTFFTVLER